MIQRVLIANRGEIAVRVIRACDELGIESVAVYSDADATAPHVRAATRAIRIGPPPSADSYLSVARLIDAARETGADAIHPGYGFLSERPDLADACRDAGLVFVGPTAEAISRVGSKVAARRLMERAGVPIVPGVTPNDQSTAGIRQALASIGTPALLKASAGGGGKGMRTIDEHTDDERLDGLIDAARREAEASFGNGDLYVERLLVQPRHVEIQVFGDQHGELVHLFDRECSVQRRHQKIIEESPSPAVTDALRERMAAAALVAAAAVEYSNAGTIEFLLDGEGDTARFYFLEMNTRLQVEHPVTELVAGVDLVHAQLAVAGGAPLPWSQADLTQRGHAVECRLYAEEPRAFLPQAGRILLYREPAGPGLRVDSGVEEGSEVPVEYDPLLGKLIAYAETRHAAIARAAASLRRFALLGVNTNIGFLRRILEHPRFRDGRVHTGLIDEIHGELLSPPPMSVRLAALAAAAVAAVQPGPGLPSPGGPQPPETHDPWARLEGWKG